MSVGKLLECLQGQTFGLIKFTTGINQSIFQRLLSTTCIGGSDRRKVSADLK